MTRFGERLKIERDLRGLSQKAAAALVGLSSAGFGKIERGGVIRPNNWAAIAEAFGIPADEADALINADAIDAGKMSKLTIEEPIVEGAMPPHPSRRKATPQGTLPVLGMASAGEPDRLIMMNDVVDTTSAPPNLYSVDGAYALFVHGTSMVPRYFPGEVVYVHPFMPHPSGSFCVVQVGADPNNPEGGYIKQIQGWEGDTLLLKQLNPEGTIRIPRDQVIAIHRIVGSGER